MERLPDPPSEFTVPAILHTCTAGSKLWRIYYAGGPHPTRWNLFRYYGPTPSRFDHHTDPPRIQSKGILYATSGNDAILTALAESFQDKRHIDRRRREPWLVAFDLCADLTLLDVCGLWPVTAGGNMAINSGSREQAREWSKSIYHSYGTVQGIWYPSSITSFFCAALYERAGSAIPMNPVLHKPLSDPSLLSGLLRLANRLNYTLS